MRLLKPSPLFKKLNLHSLKMTVALSLLLNASCSVAIKDETFCGVIPGQQGAACDNFLTSNPQTLSEDTWQALQMSWETQGMIVECTTSQAVADFEAEIEKLCSEVSCSYSTQQRLKALFAKQNAVIGKAKMATTK